MLRLTVVDDDAWDSQLLSNLCEGLNNIVRVGEVAFNVKLIVCAVYLLQRPGCDCNLISFRSKGLCGWQTDFGPRTEDESDRRCSRHSLECTRKVRLCVCVCV